MLSQVYLFLSAVVFGAGKLDIEIDVRQSILILVACCNLILSSLIVHSNPGSCWLFDSCD